jgi:3',5'-cyclic AMP phosphodiesterase CpdA
LPILSNYLDRYLIYRSKVMLAQIFSDLHLDMQGSEAIADLVQRICAVEADLTIIPGDLTTEGDILAWMTVLNTICKQRPVIFVPGNHDYYGRNLVETVSLLETYKRSDICPTNLHILQNSSVEIQGQRFVGSTAWFRLPSISSGGGWTSLSTSFDRNWVSDWVDCRWIKGFERDINSFYEHCCQYLYDTVKNTDVVITHHYPTVDSIHPGYQGSRMNAFFHAQLGALVASAKPKLWIHGHTHYKVEKELYTFGTKIRCNPLGYPGENPEFSPNYIVEI